MVPMTKNLISLIFIEIVNYNNEETKLSSIVKMPNEQLTVQELLSSIMHLFNKKVL
jgi:hypothetical protein